MADDFTQANRRLRIATPLGPDALLITALSGTEGVSTLFHFQAELLGRDEQAKFDDIVGKNVTISIAAGGGDRYLNGIVSRFSQSGTVGEHAHYRADIVPWTWFLTRTSDCRIFQKKSVPDIVQQIFGEYGFSDYKLQLGSHQPREYCVQYRETDFNFIARLLEEEGIFFFFDHEDGKHTMVIADGSQPADPCPVLDQVRFVHEQVSLAEDDVVTWFAKEQEVRPAHHTLTDYNFEKPSLDLAAHATGGDPHKYEIYDYPAGGETRDRTESLARLRQEEEDARRIVFRGHGFVRSFTPGFKFSLTSVGSGVSSTFDGSYVLSTIHHHASEGYGQGEGSDSSYENEFECIDSALRFRPPRHTPRPVIQGVQTAVVVGPAGEEIFVDRHGRVKVQFFWDREGKRDENSSCWLRVSQPWAGKGWGGVSIPRIGQEVIVSFMEGDPDRPIIVGRVYNGEQMPPYAFPAGGVVSGLKSQTHKGAGYNELSMDDTAGKEKFTIHGQYDMNTKIEHDYKLDAGNVIEEQAPTHIMLTCGGSYMLIEPGKITLHAGGNADIVLDANALMQSSAPSRVFLDGNALVQSSGKSHMLLDGNAWVQSSGKALVFLDANCLAQSSGGSQVFLDGNAQMSTKADATVSGANVNGIGSSKVSLSGGGSSGLELAGGGATMSGPKATVSGAGSTEITGAIVKIN